MKVRLHMRLDIVIEMLFEQGFCCGGLDENECKGGDYTQCQECLNSYFSLRSNAEKIKLFIPEEG